MEAVRRKQGKKARNKAKANGHATVTAAVDTGVSSADVSHGSLHTTAYGAVHETNGSSAAPGHSSEEEPWELDDTMMINTTGPPSRKKEDEMIAQHEADIMELLGGTATTLRIPTAPITSSSSTGSLQGDLGMHATAAVPSAPDFGDSDDEEVKPANLSRSEIPFASEPSLSGEEKTVTPPEPTVQEASAPGLTSVAIAMPAPVGIEAPASTFRPSAPPDPNDSPQLPANSGVVAASTMPSAPLEDENVGDDLDQLTRAHASRTMVPTALTLLQEEETAKPSIIIEPNAASLKRDAPSRDPVVQGRRLRMAAPDAKIEKAGETVRSSIDKLRAIDVNNRLYPTVIKSQAGTSHKSTTVGGRAHTPSPAERHAVFIKLEPHSNFEMNLLRAAASQKRQEAKMHNIEINKGDLYGRLERYLYAEYLLHTASTSLEARKKDVDAMVQKVWLLEMKRLSSAKKCGDQIDMEEVLEFQTARFDALQHAKLKAHLESIRQLRTVEASLHTFDRALSYFHVEQYINEVVQEPAFVSYLNKMSAATMAARSKSSNFGEFDMVPETISFYEALPTGTTLASSVEHLKYCIDVMIFFEKKVTVDDQGLFGRVPPSFARGELVWQSSATGRNGGTERKVKCYACSTLNAPMEPNHWCKFCVSCGVVLFLPPSSVSNKSNDWYTSVLRFRQSLQKWISLCLRTLLRLRSLVNMPYLLMHVMYLPRISTEERSWILRFLQFPKAVVTLAGDVKETWSEDLVDHYVAMLHLVFHPEKLRRLTTLVSSELPTRHKGSKERKGDASLEWVLLENPEMLDRCYLSDEDFVVVMNQFPHTFAFEQLFACTMDAKKCFSRALALVIEFTQGLRLFQEFERFPARVAQLLGELLLNASMVSAASSSGTRMGEGFFYPTLFDQLFLTALHGLLVADCNRVAWRSIRTFPFAPLSALAKWDVLGLLLFGISSVPSVAKSASGWSQFIDKACVGRSEKLKPARAMLHDQIISDPDNAMHLMHAVARLAASAKCDEDDLSIGKDLVLVTTQELFLAGFVSIECRQALGESGERAAGPVSTICLAHPWVISELIALLFKYHECAETWIHVFETFPVNRWLPTPADLTNLQEWLLLDDTISPRSALARFLLDRINWEFDVKSGQLFTNAYLHRQVALVVAEALLVHHNRRRHGNRDTGSRQANGDGVLSPPKLKSLTKSIRRVFRLDRPVDFEQWCWKLMLKLKFYSPRTHQPFVELVDLRNDRSREALLLRRWFPGGAGSPVVGAVNTIRFFEAFDQQMKPFGSQCDAANMTAASSHEDFSHKAALVGAGSSGAPIQDESAVAITQGEEGSSSLSDSTELVSSVAVTSTCDVEPIVAYLICQASTFVFCERMDRWEPLLVLLKSGLFTAGVKVIENVLPLMAKLDRVARSRHVNGESEGDSRSPGHEIDHALSVCMASMENLSTDQLLQLVQGMEQHSFISMTECQLLSELLQKGYIGGWESTAKGKVVAKLRFVRECSTYLHPLVLPSLINESFPQSSSSSAAMISTAAMFQGAMSWLTSALRGGHSDPPSPSAANSISSAFTIRKSHLVATVPTAVSTPGVTAAAAAASLGIVDAPGEYTAATQQLCSLIERVFEVSTTSALTEIVAFWAKTVLQVPLWFEHPALRHIFDVLLRCSMREYYNSVSPKKNGSSPRAGVHLQLVSILQAAFDRYCVDLKRTAESQSSENVASDAELPPVVSYLPAYSSVPALASIFGGNEDPAQFIGGCSAFAFWALLVEVRQELPLFMAMGQVLVKYEPAAMKKVEKFKKTESKLALEMADVGLVAATNRLSSVLFGHVTMESLSQFKIYRWAAYCLQMREDDELQILFWQVFFALYFACAGGTRVFGHYFLDRQESSNPTHGELRKLLQGKLRAMTTFSSNQAQLVLTVTGGSASGNLTSEGKELKYHHFVQLSHIYTAMDAWLEERDPNKWLSDDELATLPRHFEVARLKEVLTMSGRLLKSPTGNAFEWESLPLWMELCGFEFHAQVLQGSRRQSEGNDNGMDGEQENMSTVANMDHLQEEDFAFIEDHDMRRYSSLGSSADHGRTTNPLQLTSEFAGPVSLTVLPQVTIETLPDRCSVTPSVPLNKHALKTLATKFSETMSILVGLDAEILDHVSKLYVSKVRIITESRACLEGTNCRKPAAFRFEFTEWAMDKQLMDTVQSTVVQAERYEMRSMGQQSAMSSSLTSLLLDSERRRNETSMLPEGVDEFLRLDADNLMLSMQILLIDQVVQVLQVESEKLKRAVVVAQATRVEESSKQKEHVPKNEEESSCEQTSDEQVVDTEEQHTEDLAAKAIRDAERQVERLHEKGLEWFRQLTELNTKLARMVPPLREVLWRSIKQLGIAFVCVDERETCNLLQLMLEDPSRITLLSECFSPASAPARFVEMFSNLMSASSSSKLSSGEKLVLLQRFDFTMWLSAKPPHTPTKFDRETILCIVLGDIGANSSGAAQQETTIIDSYATRPRGGGNRSASAGDEEQVLRLYARIIHQICGAHLDDHLEKVLHALVGVHDDYRFSNKAPNSAIGEDGDGDTISRLPRPAPAIVWEAIVSIPATVWQQLPFVQTEACVTFLSQHMTTLRWQASMNEGAADGVLFLGVWQRSGALKSYLDLFSQLSRTTPEAHKWTMISTFFEPLLTTLYQPASTTESSTVSCPWSENDALTTGTTLCSCFVSICTDFLKSKPKISNDSATASSSLDRQSASAVPTSLSSKEKLDLVWSFYLGTLIPHAPVHVCKSFHQFVTRLGWEQWCLTIETVHQMREVVQSERQQLSVSASCSNLRDASATSSPYPFVSWMVRDVLCRMTWKSTEDWLATQTEAVRSVFLAELGKLCVDLVLDLPHFQPQQPRSKNNRGMVPASAGSSSNVLPPYFVNFIKQQSTLWFKWKMNDVDLESFLTHTLDAVTEPIRDLHRSDDAAAAVFPSNPSVAVMQDAFLRLQLVLRRVSHVTTLNHSTMTKRACLQRANLFFKMAFTIFENGLTSVASAREYSGIDSSAWVTVLFGATCAVLYEKLDEIVQLSRVASEPSSSLSPEDTIREEDLLGTVVEVLRLFNLRLVEAFFKREQHSDSTLSSNALAWGKCGNVIFVEVDSLIRDFPATHKLSVHAAMSSAGDALSGDDPVGGSSHRNGVMTKQSPSTTVVDSIGNPLGRLLWSFMGFRGGELCCLSACGRAIASVHVMSVVSERSIEKWIIEERRGSWTDLVSRLKIPELSEEEFEGACLQQGHLLTLQLLFLQQLKKAPVLSEAFAMGMLGKLLVWMEKLHLLQSTTALLEMKVLFLAAEVVNFVCKTLVNVLPANYKKQMLRELCQILLRFGNARRQHGIMKAIGIGGSLQYNVEFHVCALTMGVFLRLQTRNGAPLRVDDRIAYKLTRTTERHLKSLEQLLASKNCIQIHKRMEWMVAFLKSPTRSLADQDELIVSLFARMYPSHPWMLAKCISA